MSTTELVGLIAMLLVSGGVATYVVQWVKRSTWSSRQKFLTSALVSIAFGLANAWLAGDVMGLVSHWGDLTATEVFAFIGAVYATSTGFYETFVKPRASSPTS